MPTLRKRRRRHRGRVTRAASLRKSSGMPRARYILKILSRIGLSALGSALTPRLGVSHKIGAECSIVRTVGFRFQ